MKKKRIQVINETDKESLTRVKNILETFPEKHHTIESLSLAAGINRNKLTYGFKQLYEFSVHQFLIKTRMGNAKKLLLETEKPIKEIAKLNGYDNTQNFITAFKNYWGRTPSQIQRKNIEKENNY